MKAPPTLETERLLLRPFAAGDAAAVARLAGDRRVADTTLRIPHPYDEGMAAEWIATHAPRFEAGEQAVFAVTGRADGALAGAVGLVVEPVFDRAELGYWIGVPFWNRGYCTEACRAVLRYGFAELGLHRVFASRFLRNEASGRVMRKLGMTREGMLRQHEKKWDRYEDLVVCGILRDEWQASADGLPGRQERHQPEA